MSLLKTRGSQFARRSIQISCVTQGGTSTPGTSNEPASTTSYSNLTHFLTSFLTKVENPLTYLNIGTKKTVEPVVKSKTQRILSSHEGRISRAEVTSKTRALVKKFLISETSQSKVFRLQQLSSHIMEYPPTRYIAAQEPRLIAQLLDIVINSSENLMREEARQCLTLIGIHPTPKGRGVNVLSIDGGGTRGMMGLAVLEQIEKISGKKICELFDLACGVSTGAIIATLLTAKKYTVKECMEIYRDISIRLFSQGKFQGGLGVILNHSYYNTQRWTDILKEIIGENVPLIDTSRAYGAPRLAIVAAIVNLPTIQPYVFRNYDHSAGRDSHYRGSTKHELWKAIQATAAAPLYFKEVEIDNFLLQDGGIIANNPSAIAYHEAKLLWPDEKIHCVVSVGNGRSMSAMKPLDTIKSTSFQYKLAKLIDSATDTEAVHLNMNDMLSHNVYYRFNPYMSSVYGLDEINADRLEEMTNDATLYVRRNRRKIEIAAKRLAENPTISQKTYRWFREKLDVNGYYRIK